MKFVSDPPTSTESGKKKIRRRRKERTVSLDNDGVVGVQVTRVPPARVLVLRQALLPVVLDDVLHLFEEEGSVFLFFWDEVVDVDRLRKPPAKEDGRRPAKSGLHASQNNISKREKERRRKRRTSPIG